MKSPVTVIIPCKDESHHIAACVASARPLAEEIIVADSGSTDGTLDIVRGLSDVRLIEREYVHSADFKNWAIPHAGNDWVLILDADERLTPELRDEIAQLFHSGRLMDAYRVRFAPFFLGHPIRHCGWNSTTAVRLFRKSVARYSTRRVHADVIVDTGRVAMLTGKIEHYTCTSLERWMEKRNRYTAHAAWELHAAGRRVSAAGLLLRPVFHFVKSYLLRGGMLDGVPGLIVSIDTAFSTFLKYAKLWEMQQRREPSLGGHATMRRPHFARAPRRAANPKP